MEILVTARLCFISGTVSSNFVTTAFNPSLAPHRRMIGQAVSSIKAMDGIANNLAAPWDNYPIENLVSISLCLGEACTVAVVSGTEDYGLTHVANALLVLDCDVTIKPASQTAPNLPKAS